jgi:hypothetical protein
MENDETKSRYHRLEKPEFISKIPAHLVARLDDKERWLVETLSKLDFKTDWVVDKVIESNEQQIDIDVRLQKIESWKAVLSGKWALLGAVGVMVVTALLSAGAKTLVEHFFKGGP